MSPLWVSVSSSMKWKALSNSGLQSLYPLEVPSHSDILTPPWSLGLLTSTASLRTSILCWGRNGISKQKIKGCLCVHTKHKPNSRKTPKVGERWSCLAELVSEVWVQIYREVEGTTKVNTCSEKLFTELPSQQRSLPSPSWLGLEARKVLLFFFHFQEKK